MRQMASRKLKNHQRILIVTATALLLPIAINYILYLPGTYIDGNSLTGGILLAVLFYLIQSGIAIVSGRFLMHLSIEEMGFNLKNVKLTFRMLGWFIPLWLIVVVLFYVVGLNWISDFDSFLSHYFVKDKLMMQKDLIIGCLLAGAGEEPFFRGFVAASLVTVISGHAGVGKAKIPLVAIISGLLFMLAHIEYQIMPFQIIYIDGIQLGVTFILGTFWSVMFIKTRSLLGPVIAHMCANMIQLMSGYFVAYYFL